MKPILLCALIFVSFSAQASKTHVKPCHEAQINEAVNYLTDSSDETENDDDRFLSQVDAYTLKHFQCIGKVM